MTLPFPLVQEINWVDPISAFNLFAGKRGAIFLDSAQEKAGFGQYSFIAVDPFLSLSCTGQQIQLGTQNLIGNPFLVLKEQLAQFPLTILPNLPPFQGGVAGFFGYELVQHLENITTTAKTTIPDMMLGFYDIIMAFDIPAKKAWIFSSGYPEQETPQRIARAQARLIWMQENLNKIVPLTASKKTFIQRTQIKSNFTENSYQQAVQQVIDHILAGDIFQANISQCFSAPLPEDFKPFELYQNLRQINPALFAAFINAGDVVIASASPERFLHVNSKQVTTCPIKGTRPRGATPEQDALYKNELTISAKDRAENTMIVDLMRNDLSKVCADHSIQVPALCSLESFATVHHLVSVITGSLKTEYDVIDLLQAAFPGGSITGAPKVRAMEIIAEIENQARGPYCGSIGYIGFNGDMDTSIVIRTFVIDNEKIQFHAGGGITADSNPQEEYAETIAKARALIAALCN